MVRLFAFVSGTYFYTNNFLMNFNYITVGLLFLFSNVICSHCVQQHSLDIHKTLSKKQNFQPITNIHVEVGLQEVTTTICMHTSIETVFHDDFIKLRF